MVKPTKHQGQKMSRQPQKPSPLAFAIIAIVIGILLARVFDVLGWMLWFEFNKDYYSDLAKARDGGPFARYGLAWPDYRTWRAETVWSPLLVYGLAALAVARLSIPAYRLGMERYVTAERQHSLEQIKEAAAFAESLGFGEIDPELEKIREKAGPGVMFRREYPRDFNRPTRSFFGGLPFVPENFDWPSGLDKDGKRVHLPFVAQIDLAELPDDLFGGLLPESGTLLFFLRIDAYYGHTSDKPGNVVHYIEANNATRQDAAPPDTIQPYEGNHAWGKWQAASLHRRSDGAAFRKQVFPRWDVTPVRTQLYKGIKFDIEALTAALAPNGIPDLPGKTEEPVFASDRTPWLMIDTLCGQLRESLAGSKFKFAQARKAVGEKKSASVSGFPLTKTGLENCRAELNEFDDQLAKYQARLVSGETLTELEISRVKNLESRRETLAERIKTGENANPAPIAPAQKVGAEFLPVLNEQIALHVALDGELLEWCQRAEASGLASLVSPDTLAEFNAFWTGLSDRQNFHFGMYESGLTGISETDRDYEIARSLPPMAESALSHSAETANLVSPRWVDWLRYRHVWRPGNGKTHAIHKMDQVPAMIQTAHEIYWGTHFLLLELAYDMGQDWRFGDVGVFQYWITPADLRERRFDQVKVTFEGH
jgi:uncharacterized protein YwqG